MEIKTTDAAYMRCLRCQLVFSVEDPIYAKLHITSRTARGLYCLCFDCSRDFAHFLSLVPESYEEQLTTLERMATL